MSYDWEKLRKEEWPVLETMTFLERGMRQLRAPESGERGEGVCGHDRQTGRGQLQRAPHRHGLSSPQGLRGGAETFKRGPGGDRADREHLPRLKHRGPGYPLEEGDNIITTNLEFIQVALPWCVMRKEKKFEIRVCKTEDNRFTAKDFAALADDRTKLIVMSTLEWCNGWQTDLKELGDFCKERKIMLVVDAVQQLGVTKIDTKACHIDILAAGGPQVAQLPVRNRRSLYQQRDSSEAETVLRGLPKHHRSGRRLGRILGESGGAVRQRLDL